MVSFLNPVKCNQLLRLDRILLLLPNIKIVVASAVKDISIYLEEFYFCPVYL